MGSAKVVELPAAEEPVAADEAPPADSLEDLCGLLSQQVINNTGHINVETRRVLF